MSGAREIQARASLGIALALLLASFASAQTPTPQPDRDTPDFRVQVWGDIAAEFSALVASYVELRTELQKGLPPLRVTADVAEIRRAERALAQRIRAAREARRGDIFTPDISAAFKEALVLEMDAGTWEAIMDDNPGTFSFRINGTYPATKPLSTVPPNILAALPTLPETVQYRFLGRHLILYDTEARIILDEIRYAIRFRDER